MSRKPLRRTRVATLLTLALPVLTAWLATPAAAQLLPPLEGLPATLQRTRVPAAGRHQVLLEVARFGRYTITVTSDQGVALQLVDRVAGPAAVVGRAGTEDGRLDLFLDRGTYKLITHGHEHASGQATLAVDSFAERNADPAPQLIELKPIDTTLADLEQRSYWLHLSGRDTIAVEAAGRSLHDLRLWFEGSWLVDAEPAVEFLEPVAGRPLLACRLSAQLEPGLYLLTAYGGQEQPWAEDSGEHPFHLRLGVPILGTAGRARLTTSPFGIDRWLVPAAANFYRLELPEQLPATLTVSRWERSAPFAAGGSRAEIAKDSRQPVVEVRTSSRNEGYDLVTVRAAAGQPYLLQHFAQRWQYRFNGSGSYWISTVHSGHPEDSVDATGIIAHWDRRGLLREPLCEQTIVIDSDRGWATRCNLLDTLTVFLDLRESGSYTIDSDGVEARFRIEPFFVYRPPDYEEPPAQPAGSTWELDAGYYVLTVEPVQHGILDIALRPHRQGGFLDAMLALFGADQERVTAEPVTASVRFAAVDLEWGHAYTLFVNQQPGVHVGAIMRQLPLSLDEPLPLTLRPDEEVTVPFRSSEPSLLAAMAEDGTALDIALDRGRWQGAHEVAPGSHQVTVRNRFEGTVVCSLGTTPLRLLATSPLPPLPEAALASLPDFPLLAPEQPTFFDLEREQRTTFLMRATTDALYRLESTGLLDTEGRLRSRLVTDLARSADGGSGRNFFLHQYLHQGDYQLTVSTRGRSQGHLGLRLTATEPEDGGELKLGLPARIALDGGQSVLYRFAIAEPGTYRLRSFALGRSVRCRLEDADGWPIARPNIAAEIERFFEPGSYRLLLLPEAVSGRRLTLLERVTDPPRFTGHGPHRLPLDTAVSHRWHEPAEDQARVPDIWLFDLAGATETTIRLSGEMQARLLRLFDDDAVEVAQVPPSSGLIGHLEAGSYRLEAVCSRHNNRVDYIIEISPQALVAGLARNVTAPASLPLAIGDDSLVEITSFGSHDVRATLSDASGAMVAASDDRAQDWNFHLAARLDPGTYTLAVDPVGSSSARTEVRMDTRAEVIHPSLELPLATTIEPGADVHLLSLPPAPGELLLASARSSESIGLAVERAGDAGGWETVISRSGPVVRIELPPQPDARYRLRLWSVDLRDHPIELAAMAISPRELDQGELARGVRLEPVPGFPPPVAVAAVRIAARGALRHHADPGALRWSSARGQALAPAHLGVLPMAGERAWLAVDLDQPRATITAERLVLAVDSPLQLGLDDGSKVLIDVAPARDGPLLVLASSMLGQPAVRLLGVDDHPTTTTRATAVSRHAAAAVAPASPHPAVLAWLAEPTLEPIDVRLRLIAYAPAVSEPVGFGTLEGELGGRLARAFALPAGGASLNLTLTPGVVAALTREGRVTSVHLGGGESLVESLSSDADTLLLLHAGERLGRFTVDILPPAARPRRVGPGASWEGELGRGGSLRLAVDPCHGDGCVVHVLGATAPATLIRADGTVARGQALSTGPAGGTLRLPHGPSPVVVWLGPERDPASGLWAGVELPPTQAVTLPARLQLSAPAEAFRLAADAPLLLAVVSDGAGVFRLSHGDESHSWVATHGGCRHLLLPAAGADLAVRGLAGQRLGHALELTTAAVSEIGEGLGPEVFLAPGAGRAFRFTVREPGPVGLGVRADSDIVDCELLTAAGEVLGSGIVQLHTLEPGSYLLLVRAPPVGDAVRARPAVVGIERPSTGPPEEVIRSYLRMEGFRP